MTLATTTRLFTFFGCGNGGLHIRMDFILVLLQILQDVVLKGPLKEIELSHRSIQTLEVDVLPTAKRVKHPLGLRLEMRLVRKLYDHLTSGGGCLRNILLLGLIRDKPVEKPQRNLGFAREDSTDAFQIGRVRLKAFQAVQYPLFFGLNGLHMLSCSLRRENGFSFVPSTKGSNGRVPSVSSRQPVERNARPKADEEVRTPGSSHGIDLQQDLSRAGPGLEHGRVSLVGP